MKKIQKSLFTCARDGLTIRGIEYRPEGERLPIVIVSHGFLSSHHDVEKYAKQFAEWGYAAYCFDFCGGGIRGKSDGKLSDMTIFTEKEDLKAVISYVKGLPYVNSSRLTLMGCSQGGFVSALTAVELQEQITRLILFYPALCIPDDARRGKMMFFTFDPDNIPEKLKSGPFVLGRDYAASVQNMDPFAEISCYHGPVLIVHGTEDSIVKISYAEETWKAYQVTGQNGTNEPRKDIQLVKLDGAEHGFNLQYDEHAMAAVRKFLCRKAEILTIDVNLTGHTVTGDGPEKQLTLPFEGEAKSPYFKGTILPGAADVQELIGTKLVKGCASYTMEGTDYTGTKCSVHIENVFNGNRWKPTVTTDSRALSFLNGADCDVYLEGRKKGPLVRIYVKR